MPSMKYKDIFYLCSFYHNAIFYSSFVNLWIVCDQLRGGRNQLATSTLHHVQFVYLKQYWEETLSRATQTNRQPSPCTALNVKVMQWTWTTGKRLLPSHKFKILRHNWLELHPSALHYITEYRSGSGSAWKAGCSVAIMSPIHTFHPPYMNNYSFFSSKQPLELLSLKVFDN